MSFENTAGKGEIARDEQFLLFPQCFLPVWRTFFHFHSIRNCRLQTVSLEESKICCLVKCGNDCGENDLCTVCLSVSRWHKYEL